MVTDGVDGSQDVTYAVTYTNDEVTGEEITDTTVTSEPVTEVVGVGTKPAPPPPPSPAPAESTVPAPSTSSATADLNWARTRPVRVERQPPSGEPCRLLRPVPVQPVHLASVRRLWQPGRRQRGGADDAAHLLYERSAPVSGLPAVGYCSPSRFTEPDDVPALGEQAIEPPRLACRPMASGQRGAVRVRVTSGSDRST